MKKHIDNTLKVSVIGAGSFGSAIAKVIAENYPSRQVTLWCYEKNISVQVNTVHINDIYLPEIQLPVNIIATNNIQKALADADLVLITVPSKSFTEIVTQAAPHFKDGAYIALMSKGFAKIESAYMTMSKGFAQLVPQHRERIAGIYGPSHSIELCRKFHTSLLIASKDEKTRAVFRDLLENDYIACRESTDVVGCELGGALKNPVAIAAGVISMLPNCGDNINGVLLSQGFMEIVSIAKALGAIPETLYDIAGLGDLVCTSLSDHGKNRHFGRELFKEYDESGSKSSLLKRLARNFMNIFTKQSSINPKYLAEGIYAITPIIEISEKYSIPVPLFLTVYNMIQGKSDGIELLNTLKYPDKAIRKRRNVFSKLLNITRLKSLRDLIMKYVRRIIEIVKKIITKKSQSGSL